MESGYNSPFEFHFPMRFHIDGIAKNPDICHPSIIDFRDRYGHSAISFTTGETDIIPSPIVRIMEMGPKCAKAVGVFKSNAGREYLTKKKQVLVYYLRKALKG